MSSSLVNNLPKEFVKREHEYESGRCVHCGETVSNASWLNCVDRAIGFEDFPEQLKSYAKFRGLKYKPEDGLFVQPYGDTYTVAELYDTVNKLTKHKQ